MSLWYSIMTDLVRELNIVGNSHPHLNQLLYFIKLLLKYVCVRNENRYMWTVANFYSLVFLWGFLIGY